MGIKDEIIGELTIGDDLDEEFQKQAPYFATWAIRHAKSEDIVRKCEETVDLTFARLYSEYKERHPDSKENEAKSYVRKHDMHKEALAKLNRAKLSRDILKGAVRAFEMRRDMLIQLGANRRQEFDGHPTVRKAKSEANKVVRAAVSTRRKRRR